MSQPWYTIRRRTAASLAAAALAAGTAAPAAAAEVYIYGDIGESWWGDTVAAATFVREVAALDVTALTVRINSVGGSVQDGVAIYNALRRHPAQVTTIVDGYACSIASLIAMAGDTVEMADNALLMIHAPWVYAGGNSAELREIADMLDQHAKAIATSYATKTGRSVDQILADWLTDGKDHWFTAAEAQAAGLVDSITEALPIAASARVDVSRFAQSMPRAAAAPASIPPAAAAATTQEQAPMPDQNKPAATTQAAATVDTQAAVQAALAADAKRRGDIKAALQPLAERFPSAAQDINAIINAADADTALTVEQANARALAVLAKGAEPLAAAGRVHTVEDETDKVRNATRAALLIRAGIEQDDRANPLRSHSLIELARASLARAGVRTDGLGRMDVVALAFTHSTSDFGQLLANVAEKAMMRGFDEADETFQRWTNKGSLSDFKPAKRVDLSVFPSLPVVVEGAEYKYGTVGDTGENIVLATYGRLFSITRQAIINDDLDAFSRIPRLMGRAAIRTVGNLAYGVLSSNPVMADGKALFHADHANLAAAGAVLSTASVDAARVAMARQKQAGQDQGALNIRMRYLLVPVALEGAANVVRNSEYEVGASSRNNTTPNTVRNVFDVISDPRLDDASATAWYASADPSTNDTVEVAYLDGVETPTLEQQSGWSVDGVSFKVRMDAGVKALSFRTLYKNPGA